jgi:hypothetical protein
LARALRTNQGQRVSPRLPQAAVGEAARHSTRAGVACCAKATSAAEGERSAAKQAASADTFPPPEAWHRLPVPPLPPPSRDWPRTRWPPKHSSSARQPWPTQTLVSASHRSTSPEGPSLAGPSRVCAPPRRLFAILRPPPHNTPRRTLTGARVSRRASAATSAGSARSTRCKRPTRASSSECTNGATHARSTHA